MPRLGVAAAVEGSIDEAVAKRIIRHVSAEPGYVYGLRGKPHLLQKLGGYNRAAQREPWLVFYDLDSESCAPSAVKSALPDPSPGMCLRVAVREVESWLLADRKHMAAFLGVKLSKIPNSPDDLTDPKSRIIALAGESRFPDIRSSCVPTADSSRTEGVGYTGEMIAFVTERWDIDEACKQSQSLARCVTSLESLVRGWPSLASARVPASSEAH